MTIPPIPVPTLAAYLEALEQRLPEGFPVRNRDPFSRFGTYLGLAAQVGIDARVFLAGLLPVGFPTEATDEWLDMHARAVSLARIQPGHTTGLVRFITTGTGVVPAGTVVQSSTGNANECRYVVTQDTTVSVPGGLVPVRAEQVGTRYNAGPGVIHTLVTLLPFVQAVTNDPDWIIQAGVDLETDDLLRQRVLLRWPASGAGTTYHAYLLQGREVPGITKVRVLDQHPRGQGTVDVIVAPLSGAPTAEQITAAQVLLDARRPVTADVRALPPTLQPVNVTVTLYLKENVTTTAAEWQARIQTALDALGIGDTWYPSSLTDQLMDTGELKGLTITSGNDPVPAQSEAHLITSGILTPTLVVAA